MPSEPKIALCLPGGGAMSAMFQIGALAALEDAVEELCANEFDVYVGTSSGASVAAALAGGLPVQRLYRAFLDPADVYFGLERKHLLRVDVAEWRRTLRSAFGALRYAASSLIARSSAPAPAELWEELDRLYDSLPAGLFSLERYERFLEEFFVRRGVPTSFLGMPCALRILAHDLDSGEPALFGAAGFDSVSVTRACIASMAVPPLFSPVRIADRHYINAGAAQAAHLESAVEEGADVLVVVNPMVAICAESVPTGHGERSSLRDKGMMWVLNQAMRTGMHRSLRREAERLNAEKKAHVIVIEPEPQHCILFMYNPVSFEARRNLLEYAYRHTRSLFMRGFADGKPAFCRTGWRARSVPPPSLR